MGDVELEVPDLDVDEEAGRFRRLVALAVVLVTFVGSIVAYAQAVESNKEDVAAREAQREAIRGLGDQVDASTELSTDLRIGSSIDAQRQRQALNAARIQAISGDASSDVHLAARERFAAVAEALAALTTVDPADLGTVDERRAVLAETPDAARLRQGVEADLANDHGDKADSYVAVLTVLAVSLFLLGLSLTVQGRSRFILAAPGVLIAVVTVAWALLISSGKITRVSERAIESVAEGQRLEDAGDLDGAIEAYSVAIDDSPDFAAAFARRSSARFLAGSPQTGQTAFRSITSDRALAASLADLERALDLGASSDVGSVAEGGFLNFLATDYDRSIELSQQAIELNDRLAPVWFNLGVAHVARGDGADAERAYRQGIRVLDSIPDAGTRAAVLAGARTDLSVLRELLSSNDLDDVDDLIEDIEVSLAAYELASSTCDGEPCPVLDRVGDVGVGDASFSRSGAFVFASIPVDGLEPGDPVAAVWYFRTDDSLPFEQAFLSFDAQLVAADGTVSTSTLPTFDPPCPVAGEYLVRLYAGDELVGETTGTIEPTFVGEAFSAFADPIEGFEACQPEGFDATRADLSELDAFTTFGTDDDPFLIGVNVTPGGLVPGVDPLAFVEDMIGTVAPGADPTPVQLFSRDIDGNFLFLDGLLAVDESEGVAVAAAAGPDSSTRVILLTGEVDEDLLREVIGLVTFTGVGTSAA